MYVDEAYNELDVVLVSITQELIIVIMAEELDIDHVLDILMCVFHLTIDRWIIATSLFDDYLIFKSGLYEFRRVGKIYSFIRLEYGSSVDVVMEYLDKCFDELKWNLFGPCWLIKGVTVSCVSDGDWGG